MNRVRSERSMQEPQKAVVPNSREGKGKNNNETIKQTTSIQNSTGTRRGRAKIPDPTPTETEEAQPKRGGNKKNKSRKRNPRKKATPAPHSPPKSQQKPETNQKQGIDTKSNNVTVGIRRSPRRESAVKGVHQVQAGIFKFKGRAGVKDVQSPCASSATLQQVVTLKSPSSFKIPKKSASSNSTDRPAEVVLKKAKEADDKEATIITATSKSLEAPKPVTAQASGGSKGHEAVERKRKANEEKSLSSLKDNLSEAYLSTKRIRREHQDDEQHGYKKVITPTISTISNVAPNTSAPVPLVPISRIVTDTPSAKASPQFPHEYKTSITSADLGGGSCSTPQTKHKEMDEEAMDYDNPIPEILQMVMVASCNTDPQSAFQDVVEMEVDAAPAPVLKKQLVIIPDTNVWLDNLTLIQHTIEMDLGQFLANIIVLIPWMVLQEIDYNIHRKLKPTSFRRAAKFIHGLLSAKNPRVKGQRASEAIIGKEFTELMADDSILNCALQYSHQQQFYTIFLTSDVNLLNKALVHNITAMKPERDLLGKIRQIVSSEQGNEKGSAGWIQSQSDLILLSQSPSPVPMPQPQPVNPKNRHHLDEEEKMDIDFDDPMEGMAGTGVSSNDCIPTTHAQPCTLATSDPTEVSFESVITSLQKTLSSIIIPKMVDEYGLEDWKFAIKIKPPFSVESALKCIQVHWIAVFSFVFSSPTAKSVLDELLELFKTKHGSRITSNDKDLQTWRLEVVQMSNALLSTAGTLVNKPRIFECQQLLQSYGQLRNSNC